ncbi:Initiator Replication protein [Desulfurella multipotens]|uniref:Initiator Replication protein n=1 Tax=Desulfurella multipotens TaxID=79269 RepID=A0A1G6S114_9BACT|nr:replication initiation protein [Desulfurella multipotens]SDD09866.1 Initiator Replication protein [Desulfurella multipotens]
MVENLEVTKTNENALVVKHNNLVMSRYNLSLAEQRLILQVASMIEKDDEDFKTYTVYVSEYLDLIDSNAPTTYRKLKEFAETLLKKPLYIPQDGGFLVCNWFAGLKYESKRGVLLCSFHPDLKPYLLQLKKNFTAYRLKNILKLQSKYSIRLYEILKSYQGMGHINLKIDDFRKILAVPDDYKYNDIKRRILQIAQRELKKYTDITFEFKEIKRIRKVVEIQFTILSNLNEIENKADKSDTDIRSTNTTEQEILDKLLELIPEEKQTNSVKTLLLNYLKQYASDYVLSQIQYTNDHKPKEWLAYLKQAIKEDYASYYDNLEKEKQEQEARKKEFERRLKQLEEEREKEIEIAIDNEKTRIYKEYLNSLEDEEKKELLNEYLEKAKELYPGVDEKSFEMEFKVERLITEDIIAKNEIFQRRLEKAKIKAEERAQILFEADKKKLIRQFEQD